MNFLIVTFSFQGDPHSYLDSSPLNDPVLLIHHAVPRSPTNSLAPPVLSPSSASSKSPATGSAMLSMLNTPMAASGPSRLNTPFISRGPSRRLSQASLYSTTSSHHQQQHRRPSQNSLYSSASQPVLSPFPLPLDSPPTRSSKPQTPVPALPLRPVSTRQPRIIAPGPKIILRSRTPSPPRPTANPLLHKTPLGNNPLASSRRGLHLPPPVILSEAAPLIQVQSFVLLSLDLFYALRCLPPAPIFSRALPSFSLAASLALLQSGWGRMCCHNSHRDVTLRCWPGKPHRKVLVVQSS